MCTPRTAGVVGLVWALLLGCAGCAGVRRAVGSSSEVEFEPPRRVEPSAIELPAGYQIEPVIIGLNFPTAVAFDEQGTPYVLEAGGTVGGVVHRPRLLRVHLDGTYGVIALGEGAPWSEVSYKEDAFYVAESDENGGMRVLRVTPGGAVTPLVEGAPSLEDRAGLEGQERSDLCRSAEFGYAGEAFVVEAAVPQVLRRDAASGQVRAFASNRVAPGEPAPGPGQGGGLERPQSVRFDPSGRALYVVDSGVVTVDGQGEHPHERTGVLWKITRTDMKH
jgi:hypothetical protein